ncbi:MAG: hypothetical protein KDD44_08615, partial [Bdellovibrionales bacterium]|nr:hypothetical protein [Bdellovibrionales bacterium]
KELLRVGGSRPAELLRGAVLASARRLIREAFERLQEQEREVSDSDGLKALVQEKILKRRELERLK